VVFAVSCVPVSNLEQGILLEFQAKTGFGRAVSSRSLEILMWLKVVNLRPGSFLLFRKTGGWSATTGDAGRLSGLIEPQTRWTTCRIALGLGLAFV